MLIRIDKHDWNEIVSLIENVCGMSEADIEILQTYEIVEET